MNVIFLLAALLAYGPSIGSDGVGEISFPKRVTDETPAVLLIHGRGWTGMERHAVDGIPSFLTDEFGCVSFNVEYRCTSAKSPWPACGDDCLKAANYMFSDAFAKAAGVCTKKMWIVGGR